MRSKSQLLLYYSTIWNVRFAVGIVRMVGAYTLHYQKNLHQSVVKLQYLHERSLQKQTWDLPKSNTGL